MTVNKMSRKEKGHRNCKYCGAYGSDEVMDIHEEGCRVDEFRISYLDKYMRNEAGNIMRVIDVKFCTCSDNIYDSGYCLVLRGISLNDSYNSSIFGIPKYATFMHIEYGDILGDKFANDIEFISPSLAHSLLSSQFYTYINNLSYLVNDL